MPAYLNFSIYAGHKKGNYMIANIRCNMEERVTLTEKDIQELADILDTVFKSRCEAFVILWEEE